MFKNNKWYISYVWSIILTYFMKYYKINNIINKLPIGEYFRLVLMELLNLI